MAKKAMASSALLIGWVIFILAPSNFLVYSLSNQSAFGTFLGGNGKIVFIHYADNQSSGIIYAINVDGSNQTRLSTDDANNKDYRPDWSPDGTKIAFTSYRDGNFDIYVMNADGSGQTNISNNPADDFGPDWSPDGTKIAFTSYRDNDNNEIYVMNAADGSNQTRLSTDDDADDFGPDWSPDGTKIVFASNRYVITHHDIYVMNADGSGQTVLTNSTKDETWPSWSPDGTNIAFESDQDGNDNIYTMNAADGSNQTRLTNSTADDSNPRWSPDGTKIAFDSDA
jgi:Tol biopolymer transport system component